MPVPRPAHLGSKAQRRSAGRSDPNSMIDPWKCPQTALMLILGDPVSEKRSKKEVDDAPCNGKSYLIILIYGRPGVKNGPSRSAGGRVPAVMEQSRQRRSAAKTK